MLMVVFLFHLHDMNCQLKSLVCRFVQGTRTAAGGAYEMIIAAVAALRESKVEFQLSGLRLRVTRPRGGCCYHRWIR